MSVLSQYPADLVGDPDSILTARRSCLLIEELLRHVVGNYASDLHLKVGSPPVMRVDGLLQRQDDFPPLTVDDLRSLLEQVTSQEQRVAFGREMELDFAYSVPGVARFRVNAMQQRGTPSLVFRIVPTVPPSIEGLGIPSICKELILRPRGLVLVTGKAGCGKSTTLAAMINHLNENEAKSVITIEDPIEYLFTDKRCTIRQRDMGDDTKSFHTALVHALRSDPDVIVIGEMRDLETISAAMTAAETGHLVLGTLHTVDAAQSIDRIIDIFPYGQQRQVRLQLSEVIEAVISQTLVPRIGGGRVAAFEVMLATTVIRRLIRDEKVHEITPNMEMGRLEGMRTLDQALASLVQEGQVTEEVARLVTGNPAKLGELFQQNHNGGAPSPLPNGFSAYSRADSEMR